MSSKKWSSYAVVGAEAGDDAREGSGAADDGRVSWPDGGRRLRPYSAASAMSSVVEKWRNMPVKRLRSGGR